MLHIFVDADACPVKQEIYRVARRCNLEVTLVANSWMQTPNDASVHFQLVQDGPDVADDWIVEQAGVDDIVITADIPLADRAIKKGAVALGTTGKPFTPQNIGSVLATRDLMSDLRDLGAVTGGPPPLQQADRSRFLQALDTAIQAIRRRNPTN
ncbi:MAG: YaiI/YqxD family protein [Victivallales bacterium]|nr:YaiI/YqxD family protein [Victivallales bacterium]